MKKIMSFNRFVLILACGYVLIGVFSVSGCVEPTTQLCSKNEAPTLTVRLAVDEESILWGPVEMSFIGEAYVLEVDPVTGPAAGAVYLKMLEDTNKSQPDGTTLRVSLRLPPGVRYPVSPGERVNVEIIMDGGHAPSQRVKITRLDGSLLISQYEGEFDGDESEAGCKPVEIYCGKAVYVPKTITVEDPSVEPEERFLTLQPGERRVIDVGEDLLVAQMGAPRILVKDNGKCTNYIPTWVAYSVVRVKR